MLRPLSACVIASKLIWFSSLTARRGIEAQAHGEAGVDGGAEGNQRLFKQRASELLWPVQRILKQVSVCRRLPIPCLESVAGSVWWFMRCSSCADLRGRCHPCGCPSSHPTVLDPADLTNGYTVRSGVSLSVILEPED